jgi:hypothetical protein
MHPGCYLAASGDCSPKLSREHYVTRALIDRPGLKVRGMPWQTEPVLDITATALTSKVLCQRHNSALSPLDDEALRAYEAIAAAREHATRRSLSRRPTGVIVSGEALELWALKTLAGLYATGMDFRLGSYRFRDYAPAIEDIAAILTSSRPCASVSLEIPVIAEAHEAKLGRPSVSTLFEIDEATRTMTAFIIRMHGLALKFNLKPRDRGEAAETPLRPHMLDFIGPRRRSRIYFGWPEGCPGSYVFIRLRASGGA